MPLIIRSASAADADAITACDEVAERDPSRARAIARSIDAGQCFAAVVDGQLFDAKAIAVLASLPSREVLLAQVLATFIAPLTQFLAVVEATIALPAVMADVLERERSKATRGVNPGAQA